MILKELFQQPKAVFMLICVQMWNRFSHYGMRALLVLYMVKMLGLGAPAALGIYAVYCGLVELGGIFGALLARRVLGLRRAVMTGGWLIGIGHLLLAAQEIWVIPYGFFIALGFVVVGSSLYSTNLSALIGSCYELEDPRREQGFTLFYMGINAGAFVATLLCGFLAETYGWQWGFGVAAIGMLIANLTIWGFRRLLNGRGEAPALIEKRDKMLVVPALAGALGVASLAMGMQHIFSPLLPYLAAAALVLLGIHLWRTQVAGRALLKRLFLALGGLTLFFTAEEQIGSSLLLFTQQTAILAMNPLVIILGGALATLILRKVASPALKSLLPFILGAVAFAVIGVIPGVGTSIAVVGMISFAELLIGPTVYSQCSKATDALKDPKVMALVPLGFALAASLAGPVSKAVVANYALGFSGIGAGLLLGGLLLSYFLRERGRDQPVHSLD